MQTSDKRPKDNLRQFLSVRNSTATSADLYFYGDIVSDWWGAWTDADQYPEAIRDFLKEQEGKSLNIYINSGGGSVFAGIAIYNMLVRHKGFKTVHVDGMAASIASVIALSGDRVIVPSNAFLMVHKPWALCIGNSNDCRKMAEDLDAIEVGILNVYRDHLADGVTIEEIKELVENETWLNGEEAAKYFNIEVGESKEYAARVTETVNCYHNVPKEIITSAKTGDNNAQKKRADKIKRLYIDAI